MPSDVSGDHHAQTGWPCVSQGVRLVARSLVAIASAVPLSCNCLGQPPSMAEEVRHDLSGALPSVTVKETHYRFTPPGLPMWFITFAPPPLDLRIANPLLPGSNLTFFRAPQKNGDSPASIAVLGEEDLRRTSAPTLAGTLVLAPDGGLLSHSGDRSVGLVNLDQSLRNGGIDVANRSLVLLDGVPVNDPLGGWTMWSKIPREGLARTELVPFGGATAWGEGPTKGVVQFFTLPAKTELFIVDVPPQPIVAAQRGNIRASVAVGDFGTRSAELSVTVPIRGGVLQLLASAFSTDGYPIVAPEQRGPIDVAAWDRHRWLALRWRSPVGASKKAEFTATLRGLEEFKGNGTPYQQAKVRERFASIGVFACPSDDLSWTSSLYCQAQSSANTFGSISSDRTMEIPLSDQFAVPATAFGASWNALWRHAGPSATSFGADARIVNGETRERFQRHNGGFDTLLFAGGSQEVGGIFALRESRLTSSLTATFGARLDYWKNSRGHRSEYAISSGAAILSDSYSERSGKSPSTSAGLAWKTNWGWGFRANGQHSFRLPTLNERYQPLHIDGPTIEPNPSLRPETTTGVQISAEKVFYSPPPPAPAARFGVLYIEPPPAKLASFKLSASWSETDDAIVQAHIGTTADALRRQNVDRAETAGITLSGNWTPSARLDVEGYFKTSRSIIRGASLTPDLEGKAMPQAPSHTTGLAVKWRVTPTTSIAPRLRWFGHMFSDAENLRRINDAVSCDIELVYSLSKHLDLYLTLNNVANERAEIARTFRGTLIVGPPRFVIGGIRGKW